jgi:DNA-binding response OmpR family regulator
MVKHQTSLTPIQWLRVLLLESDHSLAGLWTEHLQRNGFWVSNFFSVLSWKKDLQLHAPNLVILNRRLPNWNGFDLVARIRRDKETTTLPIIFVCDEDDETDQVVAFSLGADDVVVKPVSPVVLSARARLHAARDWKNKQNSFKSDGRYLELGILRLDILGRQVTLGGQRVALSQSEFLLLSELAKGQGKTLDRWELTKCLRLPTTPLTEITKAPRRIDSHIKSLRRKLGIPGLIQTIQGEGYRVHPNFVEAGRNGQHPDPLVAKTEVDETNLSCKPPVKLTITSNMPDQEPIKLPRNPA